MNHCLEQEVFCCVILNHSLALAGSQGQSRIQSKQNRREAKRESKFTIFPQEDISIHRGNRRKTMTFWMEMTSKINKNGNGYINFTRNWLKKLLKNIRNFIKKKKKIKNVEAMHLRHHGECFAEMCVEELSCYRVANLAPFRTWSIYFSASSSHKPASSSFSYFWNNIKGKK